MGDRRITDPGVPAELGLATAAQGGRADTALQATSSVMIDIGRSPEAFGAIGDGVADDTIAMGNFLAYLQASGKPGRGAGRYKIADDFILTSPIKLNLSGALILQTQPQRGFLQLRAAGNDVRNVSVIYVGAARTDDGPGRFRGYSKWQRSCVVWCETGGNRLENLRSEGLYNTLCLRGPVVRNPAGVGYTGADTDPKTAYLFAEYANDNRVVDIYGRSQSFAVTGHQQRRLRLSRYDLFDVVEIDVPPHTIYMTTGTTGAPCIDCTVTDGDCSTGLDGVAHKFINFLSSTIDGIRASGSAGVLHVTDSADMTFYNVDARDMMSDPASERYAVYWENTTGRVFGLVSCGRAGSPVGLIEATGASDVDIFGASVETNFPVSGTTYGVVRTEDSSEVRFHGLAHKVAGADARELLVAVGASSIVVNGLAQRGSAKLARTADTAAIRVVADPAAIQNYPIATTGGNIAISPLLSRAAFEFGGSIALYGSTTPGTTAFASKRCYVERIGDNVRLLIHIVVNGAFGGAGDVRIGPLPFAVSSARLLDQRVPILSGANITVPGGSTLVASALSGETFIRLQTVAGLTRTNLANTAMGTNATLDFVVEYETDDA